MLEHTVPEDNFLIWPSEAEAAFRAAPGADLGAAWLSEHDIDPDPVTAALGEVKLVDAVMSYDYDVAAIRPADLKSVCGRMILSIGSGAPTALAVPVIEEGHFVDLLFIVRGSPDAFLACERAGWLGRDCLHTGATVRLHADPMDWLRAGCKGLCHVSRHGSMRAFEDLHSAERILCADVETALTAWEWGFGCDDDALARFEIDAAPDEIRAHIEREARHAAILARRRM